VSLTPLTERVHSDAASPPRRKYFLLMYTIRFKMLLEPLYYTRSKNPTVPNSSAYFGFCVGCCLGFDCCCDSWQHCGPFSSVVSACHEASGPPQCILPDLSISISLACWPGPIPIMIVGMMFIIVTSTPLLLLIVSFPLLFSLLYS